MSDHPEYLKLLVERREDAMQLQVIAGNPLDADDIAMFEMFEREGWDGKRRRAYIRQRICDPSRPRDS